MSLCGSKTDTSGMNAAALANSEVAKDALDWYKQAYTDQAPLRQQAADTGAEQSDVDAKGSSIGRRQQQSAH